MKVLSLSLQKIAYAWVKKKKIAYAWIKNTDNGVNRKMEGDQLKWREREREREQYIMIDLRYI